MASTGKMEVVVGNSSIKGYHVFGIQPLKDIELNVMKELNNPYDSSAMLVKVPEQVDSKFLNEVTREARANRPQQTVKDTIGKTVGRVPANLCKIFGC